MPRKDGYKNIGIIVTPEQYAALEAEAQRTGQEKAELIRAALAKHISGFAIDAVPERGKYTRKQESPKP